LSWWHALLRRLTYHSHAHATSEQPLSVAENAGAAAIATMPPLLHTTRTPPHDRERTQLLIRKESKADSFQRQISALRQQLGGQDDDVPPFDDAEAMSPEALDAATQQAPPAAVPTYNQRQPLEPDDASLPTVDGDTGVIAANSRWHGALHAQGSLHIYGHAEGELTAERDIWVAAGAEVDATVHATNLIVAGTVGGIVVCVGRLEVRAGGLVSGDVTAPSLVVHDGATLTGTLRMHSAAPAVSATDDDGRA
jgi:cytoskeletal protein CcmA (bactofilin family)